MIMSPFFFIATLNEPTYSIRKLNRLVRLSPMISHLRPWIFLTTLGPFVGAEHGTADFHRGLNRFFTGIERKHTYI